MFFKTKKQKLNEEYDYYRSYFDELYWVNISYSTSEKKIQQFIDDIKSKSVYNYNLNVDVNGTIVTISFYGECDIQNYTSYSKVIPNVDYSSFYIGLEKSFNNETFNNFINSINNSGGLVLNYFGPSEDICRIIESTNYDVISTNTLFIPKDNIRSISLNVFAENNDFSPFLEVLQKAEEYLSCLTYERESILKAFYKKFNFIPRSHLLESLTKKELMSFNEFLLYKYRG